MLRQERALHFGAFDSRMRFQQAAPENSLHGALKHPAPNRSRLFNGLARNLSNVSESCG